MLPRSAPAAVALVACLTILVGACGPVGPQTPPGTPAIATGTSAAAAPSLAVAIVAGGLLNPVDVVDPGDGSGRRFIVEQPGRIRIVDGAGVRDRPFLDIRSEVRSGGEQGLLGLAFSPDYADDPRFFVDYTDLQGDTVVAEFHADTADADLADPGSERPLLHIGQPYANHNGGGVAFGPDGMLYVAMGDGGSGGDPHGNGQRTDTLLGKILRIDVRRGAAGADRPYGIPPDNPFAHAAGAEPEIWLTGLRNPWRLRFDPATGDLWMGDVGQNAWEEIDVARAGVGALNFGWNRMEGFHCFAPSDGCDQAGLTLPVAEYGHDLGCAVIGGVVVRDSRQAPFDGWYLFSDSCSSRLWLLDPSGAGRREPVVVGQWQGSISSINQAADGTVLATDLQNGELLSIAPVAP